MFPLRISSPPGAQAHLRYRDARFILALSCQFLDRSLTQNAKRGDTHLPAIMACNWWPAGGGQGKRSAHERSLHMRLAMAEFRWRVCQLACTTILPETSFCLFLTLSGHRNWCERTQECGMQLQKNSLWVFAQLRLPSLSLSVQARFYAVVP